MKRLTTVFMAIVIAISLSLTTFAASGECRCGTLPVVFVHGFGSYALYENPDSDNPETAFPPSTESIIKSIPDILKVVNTLLITKNYKRCADGLMSVLEKMMGKLACDENGDSVYNVGMEPHDLPTVDKHKGHDYDFDTQKEGHADHDQFDFYYDFRLDPMDNARDLNKFIEHIKSLTNHKKINLVCHSQGNTVVMSYLAQFGAKSIEKTIYLSPAYMGLSMVGNLFTKNASVGGKGDVFTLYFKGLLGNDPSGQLAGAIISALNDWGVLPYLLKTLQDLFDAEFDRVFDEALVKTFGTMPGVWSFCPDEYYKEAKTTMLSDTEKYTKLIKRIDDYHYNVQCRLTNIINRCEAQGMKFAICAGYNIPTIPITGMEEVQSDMLIDTVYMSIGATCAKPGETFPEGYTQKKLSGGNNYISPDRVIDASTCEYPDRTWFFKGQGHDKFTAGYTAFITDLLFLKGQPTIEKMSEYTQFMTNDKNGNLVNVTAPDAPETRSNGRIIMDSIREMIIDKIGFNK